MHVPNMFIPGNVCRVANRSAPERSLVALRARLAEPADAPTPCMPPSASVMQSAIFYGAVLRGDLNKIRLGHGSVVLDRAVIHAARCAWRGMLFAAWLALFPAKGFGLVRAQA